LKESGEWPVLSGTTAGKSDENSSPEALNEDWFSRVFHANPVPASLTTPDGRFIDVNETFLRTFGFSRQEVIGRTALELELYPVPEEFESLRDSLEKGGAVRGVEIKACTRSRDALRLLMFLDTLELGGQKRILVTAYNITMRRRAEDELRRSEAYLAEGERISHTGSWAWTLATDEQYWSQEMFRINGVDPADGPPKFSEVLKRIHPDDSPGVESILRNAVAESRDVEGEYRLMMPDGSIKHIHFLAHPVIPASGPITEYFGTIVDMTNHKRAEEQLSSSLKRVRALAGRLMKVQDEERRRIARELHETTAQDLAALKMNLSALERDAVDLDPRLKSLVSESASLAEQSMRDVRTLSYLLHPPFLDEVGLTSALRWFTTGFAQRSGIPVELTLPDDFERLPREMETTLFRIVQESLTNIHRHSGSPRAAIRLSRAETTVSLEIEDWGRGLKQVRAGSSDAKPHAFGVGIPGMRERIEQLGGTLKVVSSETGTTVRASLQLEASS
jgi:PAS domain S-box-containing protein